ncbi:hypothetical protein [Candidatus Phytoplasma sacchari]|uniref:Uncharacterized protein n=1 Tax=Candidatus Phytoplasma sacchari TaxID=2609813 RepID=A0ABY7M489_9MOLU|nr:hypothetical protein O7R10_00275 [Candidatus Phytoplasma sacchari]
MEKIIYFISNFVLKLKSLIITFYGYIITQYYHLINIKRVDFKNFSNIISNINYLFWFLIGFIHFYFVIIVFIFIQDIFAFFFILFKSFFLFFKRIFIFLFNLFYFPFRIFLSKLSKSNKNEAKDNLCNLKYYQLTNDIKNIINKEIIKNLYLKDKILSSSKKEGDKKNE